MVPSLIKHGALNCLKRVILVAMEMFTDTDEPGISLFFVFFLSCVHTMPDSFLWRHEKVSGML